MKHKTQEIILIALLIVTMGILLTCGLSCLTKYHFDMQAHAETPKEAFPEIGQEPEKAHTLSPSCRLSTGICRIIWTMLILKSPAIHGKHDEKLCPYKGLHHIIHNPGGLE